MSESSRPGAEQEAAKAGSVVSDKHEPDGASQRGADRRGPALIKSAARAEHRSGFQRTAAAIRTMVPVLQKMLPLLEGNVMSAAANLLAPTLLSPTVDLSPLEASLATLRGEIASLEHRNDERDRALKRVEEQLEGMKDGLERAAHEQKQAADELSRVRTRLAVFSAIGVALLLVSIGVNTALFLYVKGAGR
jgi:hypothetical protein